MSFATKAAGGLTILSIAFVPIGYGGTEPWSQTWLTWAGLAATGAWLTSLGWHQRLPRVPSLTLYLASLIAGLGWLTVWNARSLHDFDYWDFVPLQQPVPWLPGTVDLIASEKSMLRLTSLLGILLVSCDLGQQRSWFKGLISALAFSGASLACFGVMQKISRDPWAIWPTMPPPQNAFGTFWYHGNAAAYLNLVWPLLVGLIHRNFRVNGSQSGRAFCLTALGVVVFAVLLNVSKAGQAIAGVQVVGYLVFLGCRSTGIVRSQGWRRPLLWVALALLAVLLTIWQLDWRGAQDRWGEYLQRDKADSRLEVARLCLPLIGEAGLLGFGPGTFDAVFQHHAAAAGWLNGIRWKYAHNDYLQMLIEWGWLGALLAWLMIWPALQVMMNSLVANCSQSSAHAIHREGRSMHPLVTGLTMSLTGLMLHAAVDFPLQIHGIQFYAAILLGLLMSRSSRLSFFDGKFPGQ